MEPCQLPEGLKLLERQKAFKTTAMEHSPNDWFATERQLPIPENTYNPPPTPKQP